MQTIVNGRALFIHNNLPISDLKVELWDSNSTYGLLGITHTDLQGNFTFFINDPISGLISNAQQPGPNAVVLSYKTYKCNELLDSSKTIINNVVTLKVTESIYDTAIKDKEDCSINYITVKGYVKDRNGVEIPNVNVKIYESGFRTENAIGEVKTDIAGNYEVRIPVRNISNTQVITSRSIVAKATEGMIVIAASTNFFLNNDPEVVIDLIATENYEAPSFHSQLLNKINIIIDGVPFTSFAAEVDFHTSEDIDPDNIPLGPLGGIEENPTENGNGNGELGYIAKAIGHNIEDVQSIVRAYQYAVEIDGAHALMHSLTISRGFDRIPIISLNEKEMRDIIESAIDNNIIPSHTGQQIDDFLSLALTYQVTATREIPIAGESHSLGDVLNSIFGGENSNAATIDF